MPTAIFFLGEFFYIPFFYSLFLIPKKEAQRVIIDIKNDGIIAKFLSEVSTVVDEEDDIVEDCEDTALVE